MTSEADKAWDPETFLRERYPDVQVIEMRLPGGVQGCVDVEQRIIWLDVGLSEVARRCTLAYETGELLHGPTPVDPLMATAQQRSAADWAAQMLVPTEDLLFALRLTQELPEVAAFLGVDMQTLRARLRGMADEEQDEWMRAMQRA